MTSRRGQVPLETLFLGAVLIALLAYPLLVYPRHDAALLARQSQIPDRLFLVAALPLRESSLLDGLDPGVRRPYRLRIENAASASLRIEPEHEPGELPVYARQLGVPASWTIVRLVVVDHGVDDRTLHPGSLELLAEHRGKQVHAVHLGRLLAQLGRPSRGRVDPAVEARSIKLGDGGTHQLLLAFQERVDFQGVERASLHLGEGIELELQASWQ